tara:strand:+ start:701 stop:1282 length:582 start_codon:yes stop_codon:yes gene_type:complete
MANVKITALTSLAAADAAAGDVFVIDDISESESKKFTIANLKAAVGTTGLTASRALETNGSGDIVVSDVTSTELNHLDGVSSAIQTQLDAKIATTASASNDFVTFTRLNANVNVVQDNVAALPTSFSNARYVTTTANSYNIGVTVADINEVDVYVGGAYQSKKEYVLANSSHNVQFTDATFVAGEDIEIISRT